MSVRSIVGSLAVVTGIVAGIAPTSALGSRATPSTSPSPRATAMAGDRNGNVVLFGGKTVVDDEAAFLDDTWIWDGSAWTEQHPSDSPPARCCYGMAYDAARRQTVLFGGVDHSGSLDDTWTWDGTTWTEQHPALSPSASEFGMAYDAARRQVIVFGGEGLGQHPMLAWDGSNWQEVTPDPIPDWRKLEGLAYDGARRQVVMYGGENCGELCEIFRDTWTWNGQDWVLCENQRCSGPGRRSGVGMAYDANMQRTVLFGGRENVVCCFGDTWTWDGRRWTERQPSDVPTARDVPAMAWDRFRRQVVLFGGRDYPNGYGGGENYFDDTWTWDGFNWTEH